MRAAGGQCRCQECGQAAGGKQAGRLAGRTQQPGGAKRVRARHAPQPSAPANTLRPLSSTGLPIWPALKMAEMASRASTGIVTSLPSCSRAGGGKGWQVSGQGRAEEGRSLCAAANAAGPSTLRRFSRPVLPNPATSRPVAPPRALTSPPRPPWVMLRPAASVKPSLSFARYRLVLAWKMSPSSRGLQRMGRCVGEQGASCTGSQPPPATQPPSCHPRPAPHSHLAAQVDHGCGIQVGQHTEVVEAGRHAHLVVVELQGRGREAGRRHRA